MRKICFGVALTALAACLAALPAAAQQGGMEKDKAMAEHQHHDHATAAAAPAAAPDPLLSASVRSYDDAAGKLVSLAEEMSQEQYGWRPGEGVRSTSEVFMHVAGGNYFLSRSLGAAMPEGNLRDLEKETDKTKVVAALKASIDHAHAAIEGASDLGAEIELFGQKMIKGDALAILVGHVHEHLGQAIAYARANGVVPPWSRPQPAEGGDGGGK